MCDLDLDQLRLFRHVQRAATGLLLSDRHGATAISFSCWLLWIGADASTALYAWGPLGDAGLALISAFNAACCGAVLLLAFYKRACARFGEPEHGAGKPVRSDGGHHFATRNAEVDDRGLLDTGLDDLWRDYHC